MAHHKIIKISKILVVLVFITGIAGEITLQGYPTECRLSVGGHEYAGTKTTTRTNRTCQFWNTNEPHYHSYSPEDFPGGNIDASRNYCRNPDSGYHRNIWCYTTDPAKRWDICDIPLCECKVTTIGAEYEGTVHTTSNGRSCQYWYRQTPHRHNYTNGSFFPDERVRDASNYCRNPGGQNGSQPNGPWCYTTDANIEWEYCNVTSCDFELVTISPPTTTAVPTTTSTTSSTTTTTTTSRPTTTTIRSTTTSRPTTTTTRSTTTTRPTTTTTRSTATTRPTTITTRSTTTTVRPTTTTSKPTTTTSKSPTTTKDTGTIVKPEEPDKDSEGGKTSASTSDTKSKTTIIVSVVCVVVVAVAATVAIILYKKGLFRRAQGGVEKLEESFDNPSFNAEKSDVEIQYTN